MKILLTSDWSSPAVNGVVTSVSNLCKGLEARGHEVRILTLSQTAHSYSEKQVTYIGSVNAGMIYPGARLRAAQGSRWIHELVEWGPDVVHSNCEFSTFWMARKIASQLDVPFVHTYHTIYEDYTHYISPRKSWGRQLVCSLSRLIATQTDCMIAPTEKVRRLLTGYGITKPLYVIPTGIEQTCFSEQETTKDRAAVRQKWNIREDCTLLVFVGRLAKEKNCKELIRAIDWFRGREVALLMVGDGPCREELEQQVRSLGLENQIVFTGMVPPETVSRYYHAGDLFVSASTSETQGLTYLEALSAGLPMLCRADTCLQDVLIDGKNGWQYRTREEFQARLDLFLHSGAFREQLQQNALEIGRRFSIPAFSEAIEAVYLEQIRAKGTVMGAVS
ncbi:MAG: glycosyltransferase family 4 protein [Acetatifactor sp.]